VAVIGVLSDKETLAIHVTEKGESLIGDAAVAVEAVINIVVVLVRQILVFFIIEVIVAQVVVVLVLFLTNGSAVVIFL
jgi:hypothetical protein